MDLCLPPLHPASSKAPLSTPTERGTDDEMEVDFGDLHSTRL